VGKPEKPLKNSFERICILLLLLFTGFVLLNSSFFCIDGITVTGNKSLTPEEITRASGIPVGENIFRINLRDAAARVKAIPAVKEVSLARRFPARVEIMLIEREAMVLVSGRGGFYGLDGGGVCIRKVDAAAPLPILTGVGVAPPPGGELDTEEFRIAVEVLGSLDGDLISGLAEIHITPFGLVEAYTTEGVKIRFGRPEELTEKGRTLCGILNQVEDRKVVYIDLSVSKRPVVKFAVQGVYESADNPPVDVAGSPFPGFDDGGAVPVIP
jgi:cell division protein FtsQ